VKTAGISGIKRRSICMKKIDDFAVKSKNKNIRDLHRGL
jgi:hypothetical protein